MANNYYREMVCTVLQSGRRAWLDAFFATLIAVPVTVVWAANDGVLSARLAINSALDAGRPMEFRPLPGVGHFASLEAADKPTMELGRPLGPGQLVVPPITEGGGSDP